MRRRRCALVTHAPLPYSNGTTPANYVAAEVKFLNFDKPVNAMYSAWYTYKRHYKYRWDLIEDKWATHTNAELAKILGCPLLNVYIRRYIYNKPRSPRPFRDYRAEQSRPVQDVVYEVLASSKTRMKPSEILKAIEAERPNYTSAKGVAKALAKLKTLKKVTNRHARYRIKLPPEVTELMRFERAAKRLRTRYMRAQMIKARKLRRMLRRKPRNDREQTVALLRHLPTRCFYAADRWFGRRMRRIVENCMALHLDPFDYPPFAKMYWHPPDRVEYFSLDYLVSVTKHVEEHHTGATPQKSALERGSAGRPACNARQIPDSRATCAPTYTPFRIGRAKLIRFFRRFNGA